MHEALHGVRLGREMRDSRLFKGLSRSRILPEPDREHGLATEALGALTSDDFDNGFGGFGRAGKGGGHLEHEHGVVAIVVQKRFHRAGVAGRIRIADDVDRVGA